MDKLMFQMFEAAAKVGNEWSLAAFAVAAVIVVFFVFLRRRKAPKGTGRLVAMIVIAVVALASMPLISRAFLVTHGVYRLRVTVEDPEGRPIDDARVTSSVGGEAKQVEGGWELDIPPSSKPMDGKLTVYAEKKSAFLSGRTEIILTTDYNLSKSLRLEHGSGAHIRGRIVDKDSNPVPGVQISVVGYEADAVTTGPLGQFDLPAHAADGQQVQVSASKKGLGGTSEWATAGETPATIVLARR